MGLTKEEVISVLRTCQDPEIPVNVVDLGLVYDIDIDQSHDVGAESATGVTVKMTLTSSGCPMSTAISGDVRRKLLQIPGVTQARVDIVWEPAWSPEMITPEGRRHLQIA